MTKNKGNLPSKSNLISLLKRYPLSWICIAIIWYLSFFTPPQTQLDDVPFIDKWVHTVMWGGTFCMIWAGHWRHYRRSISCKWLALWCLLLPTLMSGIIELLQAYCTEGRRSGDWADFLANALGCAVAALAGRLITGHLPIGDRDKAANDRCNSDGRQ